MTTTVERGCVTNVQPVKLNNDTNCQVGDVGDVMMMLNKEMCGSVVTTVHPTDKMRVSCGLGVLVADLGRQWAVMHV